MLCRACIHSYFNAEGCVLKSNMYYGGTRLQQENCMMKRKGGERGEEECTEMWSNIKKEIKGKQKIVFLVNLWQQLLWDRVINQEPPCRSPLSADFSTWATLHWWGNQAWSRVESLMMGWQGCGREMTDRMSSLEHSSYTSVGGVD